MAVDSGSYTPETVERNRKIADQLLLNSVKPRPLRHWAEGLGQLGEAGLAGYLGYKADQEGKAGESAQTAALAKLLNGGDATPGATSPASVPPQASADTPAPADAPAPRGIRNNNPLNIEAGGFTQGQPGFAGTDGRFAKFETPDQGTAAASKLLDVYRDKHGLNTVAGIVGRWAPAGDGNNVSAYAANVARQMGIGPNDPIPPEMRPQLIAAMGQHENGRPIAPQAAPGQQPYQVAGPPVAAPGTPQPSPAQAVAGALNGPIGPTQAQAGIPPAAPPQDNRAKIAAMLTDPSPYVQRMGRQLAQGIIEKDMAPHQYGFQTLPDGTIIRTDPRTGKVEPTYQAATKPTFGQVGEDADGKKTFGFIDPVKGTVTPLQQAQPGDKRPTVTGPDGKEIVIPAGVDVPTFKKEVSRASADAATGKKTEVQAKAEQFANRMESAEKNISGLEGELTGMKGAAQQIAGGVPVVGSAMQTENYQKASQAKSQFITALLRQESGAAISKSEFERYDKEFFPQPGDSAPVIKQKAQERRVAIEGMKKGAGPAYKAPDLSSAPAKAAPKVGLEQDGYRFKGGDPSKQESWEKI